MNKMWNRNGKHKAGLKTSALLGALVLAVVVGLGAGPSAAQGQTRSEPPPGQIDFFDPFRLTTIRVAAPRVLPALPGTGGDATEVPPTGLAEGNPSLDASGGVVVRAPVLIPARPPIRSPHRPPWAPGKPPWVPGPPS
jgi:hypothetical protein